MSSTYICIQFKLICGTFLRYKQIYGEKLPLVKIRENKLSGTGQKLKAGRSFTPIIFIWMHLYFYELLEPK